MSLSELGGNFKAKFRGFRLSDDVYVVLMIVLVGLAGFGLGRLSKIEEFRPPVRIENAFPQDHSESLELGQAPNGQGSVMPASVSTAGQLVGSKNSDKYHFLWCPGAQRIKEGNKIWFASKEEAEAAGYTPAKNCKGLE